MLPLPFEEFIPKQLSEDIDDKGQAFIDKVDSLIREMSDEILEMYWFKLAERCPSDFLEELGFWLNAGLFQTDSELTKRRKIKEAVVGHKRRGSWNNDAKPKVDSITGYDAAIFRSVDSDDSIEMGQLSTEDDTLYWSTESGKDGSDDDLGTWEVGDFTEYVVAGNISIDCHEGVHTAVLTSAQIEQIVVELEFDIVPGYMDIYLGYIDTTGAFIVYSGGIIT